MNKVKKNKPGAPSRWPKTETEVNELLNKVSNLSGAGASKEQIAATIGISRTTFYEWIQRHPELFEAIENGKYKGMSVLKAKYFNMAQNGDGNAIRWILSRYDPELKDSPNNRKLHAEQRKLEAETERVKLEAEGLRMQLAQQKAQLDAQAQSLNDQFVFTLTDVTPVDESISGRILGGYR